MNKRTDKNNLLNQNGQKPDHKGPVQFQLEEQQPIQATVLVPYSNKNNKQSNTDFDNRDINDRLEEAEGLALAIDLQIKAIHAVSIDTVRPSTLFGQGKADELKSLIHDNHSELVIIDHNLSPGQQRNLERLWDVKILDRTGLILEIFGRRAATREGRLQVELAHLNYQKSRLVRSWTHLERQRGGSGFMGGPGETQLESDKRQLQSRIISLSKELEKVKRTRELHRKKRKQTPYPIIALVGYTNAGKSTLFNNLTGASVVAKDQLFATLDPTMRAITLPSGMKVILSDTVGFVSNLPTQLVAAFRATLEEVLEANIILHVQDASNPSREQQRTDVINILKELGIENSDDSAPIIDVWNKIDQLPDLETSELNSDISESAPSNTQTDKTKSEITNQLNLMEQGYNPNADVSKYNSKNNGNGSTKIKSSTKNQIKLISAKTGAGIDELLQTIDEILIEHEISLDLLLNVKQGPVVNWLYENGQVSRGETSPTGDTAYSVTIPRRLAGRLEKMLNAPG